MNINRPRRHLTYANVTATLALLFAMSGGALAASHYLINSTRQINPKVLRHLKGNRGPRGPAGIRGIAIQGPGGANGIKGTRGEPGKIGPEGLSPLSSPLPSGRSESGAYGIATPNSATSGSLKQSVSFVYALAAAIPPANIEYTPSATPTVHCAGPGKAAQGFLCIYSGGATGVKSPVVFEPEDGKSTAGTGLVGFALEWAVTGENAGDLGTYTVTAP
jgi:hypothetical protein